MISLFEDLGSLFFFFTFLRVCKEKQKGRLCEQVKKQRENKKESMRFLTCNKEKKESLKLKLIENV